MTSPHAFSTPLNKLLLTPAALSWKFSPGWGSTVLCSGDIDGDGRDEILVNNAPELVAVGALAILTYMQLSDLDPGWSDQTSAQFIVQWSSASGIPGWEYPDSTARGSLNNFSYFMADVDGDGRQEIVAFCPGGPEWSASIGILKWANNTLTCIWQATGSVAASGDAQALDLGNTVQVCAASNIDGTGKPSIVLLQPGESLAILQWSGSAMSCVWSSLSSLSGTGSISDYTFSANDQIVLGDVDGDGQQEIVIYAVGYIGGVTVAGAALGVAKWTNSTLSVVFYESGSVSGSPDYVANLAYLYLADFGDTNVDKLAIVTGTDNMAVLTWQNGELSPTWTCSGSIPGATEELATSLNLQSFTWYGYTIPPEFIYITNPDGLGPALLIVYVNVDGYSATIVQWQNGGFLCTWAGQPSGWDLVDGSPLLSLNIGSVADSLFCFNPGSAVALLSFASNAEGISAITANSVLESTFQASAIVPGWCLDFIIQAPATPYAPFTGTQLALYQAISLNLTPPAYGADGESGDVRYQYTNITDAETFSGWATQVKGMSIISGYSQADWDAVQPELASELGWVGLNYGMRSNMIDLATAMQTQQQIDLNHCFGNMSLSTTTSTDPMSYWGGAIVDALLWGVAATPIGMAAQVCFAVTASLFGSWANQPTSSSATGTVAYNNFTNTVSQMFDSAIDGAFLEINAVVTDQIKNRLTGRLNEVPWAWTLDETDFSSSCAGGSSQNRVMFYQMLMGAQFTLFTWFDWPADGPSVIYMDPYGNCDMQGITGIPASAQGTYQNTDGSYNIWVLGQGSISNALNGWNLQGFPEQSLIDDLASMNVVPQDWLYGQFGWNMLPNPGIPANADGCTSPTYG